MSQGIVADGPGDAASAQVARHSLAAAADAPGRRVELADACGSCGAAVQKKVYALRCRSCGALLIHDSDLTERARPDGLVPFLVGGEDASAAFTQWVSSRRFAPQTLRKGDREVRELQGVFLPVWSFSVHTTSDYVGKRGERRTRMVSRTSTDANGNTQTHMESETYTQWHRASGRVGRYFDAVTAPGCSPLAEKLPQWSLAACVPYAQGGSQGKRIIAYDVEPEYGFEEAKTLMGEQIEQDVRADIGGWEQRIEDVATAYGEPSYSLLLLPAWLVTYRHDGRDWSVLVNGASGEVVGDRPYSPMKISILIAASVLIVAALVLFLSR